MDKDKRSVKVYEKTYINSISDGYNYRNGSRWVWFQTGDERIGRGTDQGNNDRGRNNNKNRKETAETDRNVG